MAIINLDMYLAAYAGAIAGMISSNKVLFNPNAVAYTNLILAASAFAEEFDLVWGDAGQANIYEIETAQSISEAAWQERTPFTTLKFENPSVYEKLCQALIAVINGGMDYLTSQGISPPNPGSGGGLPSEGDVIENPDDPNTNVVAAISGIDEGSVTVNAIQFNFQESTIFNIVEPGFYRWQIDGTTYLNVSEENVEAANLLTSHIVVNAVQSELGGLSTENLSEGNVETGIANFADCHVSVSGDGTEELVLTITGLVDSSLYRIDATIDAFLAGTGGASWGLRILATQESDNISFWGSPDPIFAIGTDSGDPPTGFTVSFDEGDDPGTIVIFCGAPTGTQIMCNAQCFKVQQG